MSADYESIAKDAYTLLGEYEQQEWHENGKSDEYRRIVTLRERLKAAAAATEYKRAVTAPLADTFDAYADRIEAQSAPNLDAAAYRDGKAEGLRVAAQTVRDQAKAKRTESKSVSIGQVMMWHERACKRAGECREIGEYGAASSEDFWTDTFEDWLAAIPPRERHEAAVNSVMFQDDSWGPDASDTDCGSVDGEEGEG